MLKIEDISYKDKMRILRHYRWSNNNMIPRLVSNKDATDRLIDLAAQCSTNIAKILKTRNYFTSCYYSEERILTFSPTEDVLIRIEGNDLVINVVDMVQVLSRVRGNYNVYYDGFFMKLKVAIAILSIKEAELPLQLVDYIKDTL